VPIEQSGRPVVIPDLVVSFAVEATYLPDNSAATTALDSGFLD